MYIKLQWTVYELKEHLYDKDYFAHPAFNQVISLHGTDLENTVTFEQIYDAIQNKESQSILRTLRGQLTWEPDDAHKKDIQKITQQTDDDDDSKQATPSIPEISLYIRAKRTPKVKLGTLTSDEPVIQEFIASRNRESIITVKEPSDTSSTESGSSSSSHVGGYRATTFDPEVLRKKQERKALKKLQKGQDPLESPAIRFVHSPQMEPQHGPSGSVVFHQLDLLQDEEMSGNEEVSSDASSEATSESNTPQSRQRSMTPVHESSSSLGMHDKEEKEEPIVSPKRIKKKRSHRLSLYADISGGDLLSQMTRDNDDNDAEQTPLTQQNLFMHTAAGQHVGHGRNGSKMSSLGSWAGSG
eukprot:237660_1